MIGSTDQLGLITVPLEGEVLFVEEPNDQNIDLYTVRVWLTNGMETVVKNVSVKSSFGDPLNTSRIRLRPKFIQSEKEEYISDEDSIGEKVIVEFLGGNINRPIITGRIPHPISSSPFFEGGKQIDSNGEPQCFFSFQGFDILLNAEGSVSLTHRGAPSRNNRKLTPNNDESVITKIDIEKDGSVNIIDSKKQQIRVDTSQEYVNVGTDKAYVKVDLSKEDITIESKKTINIKTDKCYVNAKTLIDIKSPHIVMSSQGCKAEFKGPRYEISTPTFKMLDDTFKTFSFLLQSFALAGWHPATSYVALSDVWSAKLTEFNGKILASKL